jgi:hypothetical protein
MAGLLRLESRPLAPVIYLMNKTVVEAGSPPGQTRLQPKDLPSSARQVVG